MASNYFGQYKGERNHDVSYTMADVSYIMADVSYVMADLSYIWLKVYFKPKEIHFSCKIWCQKIIFYEGERNR